MKCLLLASAASLVALQGEKPLTGAGSRPAVNPTPAAASRPAESRPTDPRPTMPPAPTMFSPAKPAPGEEPKMVFDAESHDFGAIDEGPELETQFSFRNEGKGNLYILSEMRHCGCATTWYEVNGTLYKWGDPIPPGASGVVHFVMKTVGFSGDKPSQVDIFTNDPVRPPGMGMGQGPIPFGAVPLRVHTNIRKLFEFTPSGAISLGQIYNYQRTESSVSLRSLHGKPFEVLGFEPANDPLFELRAESIDATKTNWKIGIVIPPGRDPTNITKIVKVLTKPEVPSAMIYIIGTLKGAVDTEPAGMLPMGSVTRGEAYSRNLKIVNTNAAETLRASNPRLLDVRDPKGLRGDVDAKPFDPSMAKHVNVTLNEAVPGKQANLVILVKETMPPGPYSFRLAFDTGIPGGPTVFTIPVTGLIK